MSQGKVDERPDEYESDLHATDRAGQHAGVTDTEKLSAQDLKEIHDLPPDFRDDELRQITIVAPGQRLEQGAVYLDLRDPERREFRAMGGTTAEPNNLYVAKSGTDYPLWNRLIGVDNPARTAAGADDNQA